MLSKLDPMIQIKFHNIHIRKIIDNHHMQRLSHTSTPIPQLFSSFIKNSNAWSKYVTTEPRKETQSSQLSLSFIKSNDE